MKILFHSNQLGYRGTEVALFDYAYYNTTLLGNSSCVITKRNAKGSSLDIISKFMKHFTVYFYDDISEIDTVIAKNNIDLLYCIKGGKNDQIASKKVRTCIHSVFMENDFHGDTYAYISNWLSNAVTGGAKPFVPHIVHLPENNNDFRSHLGIPPEALVFGRYGGSNTFDVKFAHEAVVKTASKRPDIYFIFMSTDVFHKPLFGKKLKNIIHMPTTVDNDTKVTFINTCDAMLHARMRGETFGLAIGEFSARGKPVVTYSGSPERAHMEMLGDAGVYYRDQEELTHVLQNFRPDPDKVYDRYSSVYSPESVMKQFKSVFIDL